MPPARRVLIVGTQRSGTSVTQVCLAGHVQVAALEEEMHAMFFSSTAPGAGEEQRFLDTFDFLGGARDGAAVCVMKTALRTLEHAAQVAACLATNGRTLDLVIVRRSDLVAQLGSLRLAEATGTWHRRDGAAAPTARVAFTPDEVARYVEEHTAIHACIDTVRQGRRVLDLEYEQHIATGSAWPLLFRFLGVDELAPDWLRMSKRSPRPEEFIDDYAAWSAQVPALVEQARRRVRLPEPPRGPARMFLLFRAQMHLRRGEPLPALDDALASMGAPPDFGVLTQQWACSTIAEALGALGDPARARQVAALLAASHGEDEHVRALVGSIRAELGEGR